MIKLLSLCSIEGDLVTKLIPSKTLHRVFLFLKTFKTVINAAMSMLIFVCN